jgi:endogenous inhibitor of DNA gyrase (YacG/DUF329 family)
MVRPVCCPICRRPLPVLDADAPYRPFCSSRCKSIDLGGWLDGRYRISRPLEGEELDAGPTAAAEDDDKT